ncbi:hypothetical protein DPV78_003726 [Talaromyces pinophilus]|nr:hypothetical protein DPV78_003726 [Talaromyces pinophilus]
MILSAFVSEKFSKGYKSVDTDSTDGDHNRHDDRTSLTEENAKNYFDSESLFRKYNDEEHFKDRSINNQSAWSLRGMIFVCGNVVLFLMSLSLFFARGYRWSNRPNEIYRQVTTYSPVLDNIEIPFVHKQVHGELFPASIVEDQLLGRREPGPITDDLWQDYEVQRIFKLTREQVIAMGKDPEMAVKLPDETFGFGPDAYMGGLDAFHILHCYNAIRTEAFKDYYFDGEKYHMEGYGPESIPKRDHSEMFWIHLRHCNDILVQFLMCNADTTMTTYSWVETQERPFPDFSVNKKCIDFDTLVRWRNENTLDTEEAGKVRRPPGALEVPVNEMYWNIMGNETHPGDKRHHPLWD